SIRAAFGAKLFADRVAALPEAIREDVRVAFAAAADKRNEIQKYLVGRFTAELQPDLKALANLLAKESPRARNSIRDVEAATAADAAGKRPFPEIRAFYALPGEPKTPVLQRGDYLHPGAEVTPGALSAIAAPQPFRWSPPAKDAPTSGRRRAFAD